MSAEKNNEEKKDCFLFINIGFVFQLVITLLNTQTPVIKANTKLREFERETLPLQ
jgi:hypothetical protein